MKRNEWHSAERTSDQLNAMKNRRTKRNSYSGMLNVNAKKMENTDA